MATPYTARSATKQRIIASEFEAIAVLWDIPGTTKGFQLPITRFTMGFADNLEQLPSARIEAALGLNMRNGTFSEVPSSISDSTEISVYFRASGYARAGVKWPANYHLIWHGKVTGLNITLGVGAFVISIDSTHWTKVLDSGTCAASGFVRSNLVDYFAQAGGDATGALFLNTSALESVADNCVGSTGKATPALWDKIIVPMLVAMTTPAALSTSVVERSTLIDVTTRLNNYGCGVTPAANKLISEGLTGNFAASSLIARTTLTSAADAKTILTGGAATGALSKFPAKTKTELSTTKPSGFFFNNANETKVSPVNLQIDTVGTTSTTSDIDSTFSSVVKNLSSYFCVNLGTHSVLDKILWSAGQFHYKLLPNVRTVSVAPAIPLFPSSKVWRTLSADEYVAVSSPSAFPTKLAGVVFVGDASKSSTYANGGTGDEFLPTGAYFGADTGRIEVLTTPGWLANLPVERDPQAGAVNPVANKTRCLWNPNMKTLRSLIGCRLAQAQWCNSTFGGYQLNLRCPLRFDIGPGSYIKVENFVTASAVGENDLGNVFGYVQSVAVSIDAASGSAFTELTLTHVRPDSKAVEDLLPAQHPMYDSTANWSGHELVRMVQDRTGMASP